MGKQTTPLQNLAQIRAAAALKAANEGAARADVSRIPAMIITNGLLATAAFCTEEKDGKRQRDGMARIMDAAAGHLASKQIGIERLAGATKTKEMINALTSSGTPSDLQRATAEALEFFTYLKRFATKGK